MKAIRVLTIFVVLTLMVIAFSGCYFAGDFGPRERISVDDQENFELEGQTMIDIDSVSSDIEIIFEDRDDIQAEFEGRMDISDVDNRPYLKTSSTNRRISIWIEYPKNNIFTNNIDTVLTVYIPESYHDEMDLNTVSGNITLDDVTLDELIVNNVSGDLRHEGLDINYGDFSTVSGDVDLALVHGEDIVIDTVSGEINVEIPDSYELDLNTSTVSGDVHTKDGNGQHVEEINIDASTVSGDITITRSDD